MTKLFFTKSLYEYEVDKINAWARLRKHLKALDDISQKDMTRSQRMKIWHYKKNMAEFIRKLEQNTYIEFIAEDMTVYTGFCNSIEYTGIKKVVYVK